MKKYQKLYNLLKKIEFRMKNLIRNRKKYCILAYVMEKFCI